MKLKKIKIKRENDQRHTPVTVFQVVASPAWNRLGSVLSRI